MSRNVEDEEWKKIRTITLTYSNGWIEIFSLSDAPATQVRVQVEDNYLDGVNSRLVAIISDSPDNVPLYMS